MLEVYFRDGRIILHRDAEEEAHGKEKILMEVEPGKHVPHELTHFLGCLRNGTRPLTTAADSLYGLRVIWNLYEAERDSVIANLRNLRLDETDV